MHTFLFVILTSLSLFNKVLCISTFGNVFPIPLVIDNDDFNFRYCPRENGAYAHTSNCSLFHMCHFGDHSIYSCIEGYFFHPINGKCQYWPVENKVKCVDILKQMMTTEFYPLAEPIKDYDYYNRRKSITSQCNQAGIYPDILDCSIFHYCHQNKQHEIFKCPNGRHFDSKTFMCAAPGMVNCQYEPPAQPTISEESMCRYYAPGTSLPVANKFDEFIVCGNGGTSISMKCKAGFVYNALTTGCESDKSMKLGTTTTFEITTEETTHRLDSSTPSLLDFANLLKQKVEEKTISNDLLRYANLLQQKGFDKTMIKLPMTTTSAADLLRYAPLLLRKKDSKEIVPQQTPNNLLQHAYLLEMKNSKKTMPTKSSDNLLNFANLLRSNDAKETQTSEKNQDNLLQYAYLLRNKNVEKLTTKSTTENSKNLLDYAHLLSKDSDDKTTKPDDLLDHAALIRVNPTVKQNTEEPSTTNSRIELQYQQQIRRFGDTSQQEQAYFTELLKMILIIILTLIGLTLLGLIAFGLYMCIRFLLCSSQKPITVGKWQVLDEEPKV